MDAEPVDPPAEALMVAVTKPTAVARPVSASTVATVGSEVVDENSKPSSGSPFSSRALAVYCAVSPIDVRVADAGVTSIEEVARVST